MNRFQKEAVFFDYNARIIRWELFFLSVIIQFCFCHDKKYMHFYSENAFHGLQ